jgi:RNA polymerase sigma factor (sigma-70 family)
MRSHPADSATSQMARQTLLLHNLPLVQSIVTKTLRSRPHLLSGPAGGSGGGSASPSSSELQVGAALTKDDLLHEGTIGLAEALDKYDFSYSDLSVTEHTSSTAPKGARLGTYATYWIRGRILRAIQSREHAFRFPERVLQASHRLVKAAKELGLEWSTVVELKDASKKNRLRVALCDAAGISTEFLFQEAIRVRTISKSGMPTQLESWMSLSPKSVEQQQEEEEFLLEMEEMGPQHTLDTLSKFLDSREVQVLSLRYGLVSAEEGGDTEVQASSSPQAAVFRDYEAEAEDDLFGPNGILAHYSAVPVEERQPAVIASKTASAAAASITSNITTTSSQTTVPSLANTPTLLPFKDIGKKMTLSGEYCRRLCSAALDKLTRAVEEGRLAESDFSLGW